MPGYIDMIEDLTNKFPVTDSQIMGEEKQLFKAGYINNKVLCPLAS